MGSILKILPFLITPYPLLVWWHHLDTFFKRITCRTNKSRQMKAILLLGEGALESAPQLVLQLYIILSDKLQNVSDTQYLVIATSIVMLLRASTRMYLTASGCWH